jgi:hypothetical protein
MMSSGWSTALEMWVNPPSPMARNTCVSTGVRVVDVAAAPMPAIVPAVDTAAIAPMLNPQLLDHEEHGAPRSSSLR